MNYVKRLDSAFQNAPLLPITANTKYVFFSDCHRGTGGNNDNFLKNKNCYLAALDYYYQNGFCYVEAGDGDELWENKNFHQIQEIHEDIFSMLSYFQKWRRLYMLYGNHDMIKKWCGNVYEALIFHSENSVIDLRVTHGHQADFLNSVLWKLARFLVRYLWTPLESLGMLNPTSAAKNNIKREIIEKRLITYAQMNDCLILCGHTHRPVLGNSTSPYFNCGSCVHPNGITCIELTGFEVRLVKWQVRAKQSKPFCEICKLEPPAYPLYICREVMKEEVLL